MKTCCKPRIFPSTVALAIIAATLASATGTEKPADLIPDAEQLGVMLKVDNMMDKKAPWEHKAKNIERQFELLASAYVRWARVMVGWEQLEPKRGAWHWEAADKVVACARKHHVNLLWIIGSTALWDSTNGEWDGAPKDLPNSDGCFPQYVRKLVARYKDDVHYWEIRNEPNLDKLKIEQYVTYLEQGYHAVKQEAPHAQVLCGGMGGRLQDGLGYFNKLVVLLEKRNAKLPFELANFHVYPYQAPESGFKGTDAVLHYTQACDRMIAKTMQQRGLEAMPVWITEIDYPAAVQHQAEDPEYHLGESSQALFIKKIFPELARLHPNRKLFYASLIDDFDCGGEFNSTGLVQSDKEYHILQPRPAYAALRELLAHPHPTP